MLTSILGGMLMFEKYIMYMGDGGKTIEVVLVGEFLPDDGTWHWLHALNGGSS
jgi:hypothetical protein